MPSYLAARDLAEKQRYLTASDGLLEKRVIDKDKTMTWVPVVPQGNATTHLSGERWVWLQNHIGIFGAHRNAQKKKILLLRLVWWATLTRDVYQWTESCMICTRCQRTIRPTLMAAMPWWSDQRSEVMINFDGPSNLPDRQENKYVLTNLSRSSLGVLMEPITHLRLSKNRRAQSKRRFQRKCLPEMIRLTQGLVFENTAMAEMTAQVCL